MANMIKKFNTTTGAVQADYNEALGNLPQVNGVELKGNKTLEELGVQSKFGDVTDDKFVASKTIEANDIIADSVDSQTVNGQTVEAVDLNVTGDATLKNANTEALNVTGDTKLKDVNADNLVATSVKADDLYNKEDIDNMNNGGRLSTGNEYHGATSDYGLEIEEIVGAYAQETTNGYQLFDASKIPTATSGGATVTNNGNGSFTVSGSGDLSEWGGTVYKYSHEDTISLIKSGTIYISNDNVNPFPHVAFLLSTEVVGRLNKNSRSFVITEDMINNENFVMYIQFSGSVNQPIVTGTIKPMLYQDGNGTFEPFTGGEPSPNPEYKQDPQFVKIENFYTSGENLFQPLFNTNEKSTTVNGILISQNNLDFSMTGTANASGGRLSFFAKALLPAGKYYLSFTGDYANVVPYISNFNNGSPIFGTFGVMTLTEETEIGLGFNFIQGETVNVSNLQIQIEFGESANTYTPYVGSSQTPVSLKLMALPNGVADTWKDETLTHNVASVTFDGSEDEGWEYQSDVNVFSTRSIDGTGVMNRGCLCEKIKYAPVGKNPQQLSYLCCGFHPYAMYSDYFYIKAVDEFNLSLDNFKTYLQSNPITVWYQLATPTTEYYALPTLPSYYPYTNAWHDSEVEPASIQWKAKVYDSLEAQNDFVEEDYIKITETDDMVSTSSNRGGAELLAMDGAYKQVTTKGYQLFDASKIPSKSAGGVTVTNNGDGSFTISGSGILTSEFSINYDDYEIVKNLKSGLITLDALNISYPYVEVQFKDSSSNNIKILQTVTNSKVSVDISSENLSKISYVRYYIYGSSTSQKNITPITIKPMLYQDGDGTFEPFTGGEPSPNPDYPQDMKAVEVSEISSHDGKNLFNNQNPLSDGNGRGTPTETGVVVDGAWYCYYKINVKPYTDYYISYNKTGNGSNNVSLFYTKVTTANTIKTFNNGVGGYFNSGKFDTIYVAFYSGDGTENTSVYSNIMVNEGNSPLPYTPYQSSTTPFLLTLRALPNGVKDTYENGVLTRRVGVYMITNISSLSTSSTNRKALISNISDKKGTDTRTDNFLVNSATKKIGSTPLNITDNCIYQNAKNFVIEGTSEDTLETFKEKFLNTEIWYELAEPTTEVLDKPFIETYYPWTNIWTDSPVNGHMKIGFKNRFGEFYTKKEVDELIKQAIATIGAQMVK